MKATSIVILILGLVLLIAGLSRQDSLAGHAAEAGTSIANAVDGGMRTPQHKIFIGAGIALLVVGGVLAFRRAPHA